MDWYSGFWPGVPGIPLVIGLCRKLPNLMGLISANPKPAISIRVDYVLNRAPWPTIIF